ncbi:hypothetical protein IFR05_013293 [Cadophora sp. M221]|nr:hypothetical protein IFR05_013293 [Cadophora sp. M221]
MDHIPNSESLRYAPEPRQWNVVDSSRIRLDEAVASVRAMAQSKTGDVPTEAYSGIEMHTDCSYLQTHCFGLEWIGSQIVDRDAFVNRLEALIGDDDETSYCVGTREEQHGMRYVAVVRTCKSFCLRSARNVFVSYEACNGNMNETYKFGFRIILPKKADELSLNGFVARTLRLMTQCTQYTVRNGEFLLRHKSNAVLLRNLTYPI